MKQVIISDEAYEYLCTAGKQIREAGSPALTYSELVDLLILASGGGDWC